MKYHFASVMEVLGKEVKNHSLLIKSCHNNCCVSKAHGGRFSFISGGGGWDRFRWVVLSTKIHGGCSVSFSTAVVNHQFSLCIKSFCGTYSVVPFYGQIEGSIDRCISELPEYVDDGAKAYKFHHF